MLDIKELEVNNCLCGKDHRISVKEIIIEKGALNKIADLLSSLTTEKIIYLIGDKNTYQAVGNALAKLLKEENFNVQKVILEKEKVKPDTDTIFEILEQIDNDGYLIACGSGSINDLVKFVSYKMGRPYTVVATAPSMDGYASSVSAITVQGVKKTYEVAAPEAIIVDLNILTEAPWELIQAGIGDLLGKVTSLLDWQLGNILFSEYFCARVFSLVEDQLNQLFLLADKLQERDFKSIEALIKGLIFSGLAMEMVGNSRPASGCEHHISHFLDMYSSKYNKKVPPHGIKVGIAVSYTSQWYLKFKDINFSELNLEDNKELRVKNINNIYGSNSNMILKNLADRWKREQLTLDLLIEKESEIKGIINRFTKYLENVRDIIIRTGLWENKEVKELDREWLIDGFKYSFEIRARFTLCSLLNKVGLIEKWINEII